MEKEQGKQERGMGLTFLRGKIWFVQYSVGGKRFRETSESTDRAVARKLLKKRIREARPGKVSPTVADRTTVADLTQMLKDNYAANKRHSSVTASINDLHEFFGEFSRATDITPDRITAYCVWRQTQKSQFKRPITNATVNYELSMLRRAFNLAAKAGKVAAVPDFDMLEIDNVRQGFFERLEFEAIRDQLPDYLKPVVEAAYATGWRTKSELLTRQWRHLDLKRGWLRLEPGETKNKKARVFPINALPELRAMFEAQRARVSEIEKQTGQVIPWIFVRDDGSPIKGYRKAWKSACKRAGLTGKIMHDFRRTAVRNLNRAGIARSTSMTLTGHKTESVYRRYSIDDEASLREAAEKLAALHAADRDAERKVVPLTEAR